ncbi:sodium-translocating pyrophosphatase [Candidatus Methylacidithermus pantelleriae]|uniref:K(+)-insensitive pyrophosphate-energized proton pump n=1 Tax=Candidatus Methylacidithermus pantelleriae TaxID=2744239 RepID=A0A8J2FW03_9BACT|nr:sodium-translocating pyrophosphatase [Candidatus Methylacidithermus pantelleriae]CAF0696271.1 K(+)-insensitive pyrophosphate-energized proton pump [Candidatus Methylacidithermus pantelleriae]
MEEFLIRNGFSVSLAAALGAIASALFLAGRVRACDAGSPLMREISAAIHEGAQAYLRRQLLSVLSIAAILFAAIGLFKGWWTAVGFVLGAISSLLAGYVGMRVAVMANVRVAQAATVSRSRATQLAFQGGAVTGLLVVGMALASVTLFYLATLRWFGTQEALGALVGLALGASLVSVFARLGGGIYTKAADVGADLVGKIEERLEEDDPRNPATIADNVGDNVGDCAGMAADVFETYVVTLIGAILVAILHSGAQAPFVIYPFLVGAISVAGALAGIIYVSFSAASPGRALTGGVLVNALVSGLVYYPVCRSLFGNQGLSFCICSWIGLAMTAVMVLVTDYYTSKKRRPVVAIARASETGHATNIIAGLATGMEATAAPVLFIGGAILLAYNLGQLYGVALAVMSMLSMAGIVISLDAFGPITDNAGGIAVMAGLPPHVREVTDELDSIGNTTKAVTKGYAIGSAGLAALVLFGSYVEELKHYTSSTVVGELSFTLQDPRVAVGLFLGGLLPYVFTARSMNAVGVAAGAVVREVRRQLAERPGILKGMERPDYARCVDIVTKAALKEMVFPALLPVGSVFLVAAVPALGPKALGGMLMGTIVTGLFVAISMTSAGGAWDNAKKLIEEGHFGGKGSSAHAASVTGDTVGDPYKDTAGPAVNPMIKVVNVLAILIIPLFARYWGL